MSPAIIHRDIKPENILIKNKVLQIADFGWSNENNLHDFRNTFCGTPDYLAPEMILGNGHNEKLDMWTIGILMYELIHGKPPFSPKIKKANKRAQQREIEKNILEGNIEFSKQLSKECKETMIALLNGNKDLRPSATDILNFPYFNRKKQFLSNRSTRHSEKSTNSYAAIENENKELRKKIESLEKLMKEKVFLYQKEIKELIDKNEVLDVKLKKIEQSTSYRNLPIINNNSVAVIGSNRSNSPLNSIQRQEIDQLESQNKMLLSEMEKIKTQNSTIKSKLDIVDKNLKGSRELNIKFFDKLKKFYKLISEFYILNVQEKEIQINKYEQLDFDEMENNLSQIFKNFLVIKKENKTKITSNVNLNDKPSSYKASHSGKCKFK